MSSDARASWRYDATPRYAASSGRAERGWQAALAGLTKNSRILALDGPAILDWDGLVAGLTGALARAGVASDRLAMHDHFAPWEHIVHRTTSAALQDDPDFARLADAEMADFFTRLPEPRISPERLLIVFGPGAALVRHDVLWYADLPKRFAEEAIGAGSGRNLGQPAHGAATTRRLFFIDWPVLDRHLTRFLPAIDRWIDARDPADPASLEGDALRRTMADLARRPFRAKPTFKTAVWGGHWGQSALGINRAARNTAIGYELIAPESGVLIGDDDEAEVEVPFQLIVAQCPRELLGPPVERAFGSSFPVRFDYLDTVGGGDLSIHCHPRPGYMSRVFGWRYTQHETYYVMVGGERRRIFLGLREEVDLQAFEVAARDAAQRGRPLAIADFVQSFPAEPHQLFLIPAGTPHGSGEGNVVLEISSTPYLYSLRFYDWLRRDIDGSQRPVHVGHAFANLDTRRQGGKVGSELVQVPRTLSAGDGWQEDVLGRLDEMFFEVRRRALHDDVPSPDDTCDRFHVLNVVEGAGVVVETAGGLAHPLNYAETIVVPAAVGEYSLRRQGAERVRVVKALVR